MLGLADNPLGPLVQLAELWYRILSALGIGTRHVAERNGKTKCRLAT
jgi:hypothetical protein